MRNISRIILAIAVQCHDPVTVCGEYTAAYRSALTAAAGVANETGPWLSGSQFRTKPISRVVSTAIIHEDDFIKIIIRGQGVPDLRQERQNVLRLVKDWYDHGQG
ncbi:hypothetical protein SAE02_74090 [Skermanella aerolata]|uniref:Uncharacterized protein n=1 Tax=Skermanella aerolata TaxID=393310 RepID=A0A512E3E2_9PROT|nr:hypothetical protein SAE02_74090 [Skermanella aerolata]